MRFDDKPQFPNVKPLNPGHTFNIGSPDNLIQIQHKFDHVDIVNHFDHGQNPLDLHLVTHIDSHGKIINDY